MKIGLNLMFLAEEAGGAGRYAFELAPALVEASPQARITVFVNLDAPRGLFLQPWSTEVEWVKLPFRFSNRTHLIGQATALPAAAARRRLDVVHSLANGGPPITPRAARVVTMLDLIWLHQRGAWGSTSAVRTMALLTRVSAWTAHRVITISHAARDDLIHSFGLHRAKIDVAPLGVRPPDDGSESGDRVLRKLDLEGAPVVLCVAQKRPYKNLARLIRAVAALEEERPTLVLPGSPTEHEQELRRLAEQLGVTARVRFLNWLSESELEDFYRAATCFVLPSLIEGFGLPVLEAMARGVPVACSDRPALPEVVDDAALLFDPENQDSVTDAVRRLLRDEPLRAKLVERGRERVRLFTWKRTAELTLECYERAVASRASVGK